MHRALLALPETQPPSGTFRALDLLCRCAVRSRSEDGAVLGAAARPGPGSVRLGFEAHRAYERFARAVLVDHLDRFAALPPLGACPRGDAGFPGGYEPTEHGAWVDWDALAGSWLSSTEVEELAGGWTATPDPVDLTDPDTDAYVFAEPVGLDPYDPDALIFVGPKGGILRPRFGERVLRPAVAKTGLDGLTCQGPRHAAASSLVDVGVHPRVMAARIGHGTVKATMEVYARASNSADHEAAILLQQRFAEAFDDAEQGGPGVTQT